MQTIRHDPDYFQVRTLNIVHLTPGAGAMYCGGCFRDNALVQALRQLGHATTMVPLYLPLNLEEADQSAGTPVFFSGINVYLEQKYPWFRRAPRWLNRLLASPVLLRRIGRSAAKTRPEEVGDLTVSMLRGEAGAQARELAELIRWLKTQPPPDVIVLSNALLLGAARQLRSALRAPVVCTLQGEMGFLEGLPEPYQQQTWQLLRERAAEVDLIVAPSEYFGELMRERLGVLADRMRVIYNGINLTGYAPAENFPSPPALGFFARLCAEKGLNLLVDAFLMLKQRQRIPQLQLRLGGSLGPADEPLVHELMDRIKRQGFGREVTLRPNLNRADKQAFFRTLSVLSVPVTQGEAFGLYVLESLASGVPVVLPACGAFPELVTATGGGVIFEPALAPALADAVEPLLLEPQRLRTLAQAGRAAVIKNFSIERMAREMAEAYYGLKKT